MAKARKKSASRKRATRPRRARKAARRATPKKRAVKRRAARRPKKAPARRAPKKPAAEPGEKLAGVVTHYFPHVQAAAIKLTRDGLSMGDSVHIKGHTTDFKQTVESLQIEHQTIDRAARGDEIGLRVRERVRIHDQVFKKL